MSPNSPAPSPSDQTALLRILDANANRVMEGLRVVEDYVRLACDDAHLTQCYKQLRHDLASTLACLPADLLAAARETRQDVGTRLETEQESNRPGSQDVMSASLKRIEQGLRCLEEYSKPLQGEADWSRQFEALRYRSYTLARALQLRSSHSSWLQAAQIYVLVDGQDTEEELSQLVETLIAAGTDVIQLRDKRLNDRELLSRARRLRTLTHSTSTRLVINDRPDLAILSQADGVHVGQEELSVKEVRSLVGPRMAIGVSTHSLAQAEQAVLDGANYLGCGPTFPSSTKSFADFPGLDFLRQVGSRIGLPAFAIGGIGLENVDQIARLDWPRIAVSASVVRADDPGQVVQELRRRLPRIHSDNSDASNASISSS